MSCACIFLFYADRPGNNTIQCPLSIHPPSLHFLLQLSHYTVPIKEKQKSVTNWVSCNQEHAIPQSKRAFQVMDTICFPACRCQGPGCRLPPESRPALPALSHCTGQLCFLGLISFPLGQVPHSHQGQSAPVPLHNTLKRQRG